MSIMEGRYTVRSIARGLGIVTLKGKEALRAVLDRMCDKSLTRPALVRKVLMSPRNDASVRYLLAIRPINLVEHITGKSPRFIVP